MTDSEIQVSAELPGMEEKDIEVEVDDDILTLRGEKSEVRKSGEGSNYQVERSYGRFERSIPLPSAVDRDQISAKYSKGVLNITMPKTEESRQSRKKIQIES